MRPHSIVQFERVYGVNILLGLVVAVWALLAVGSRISAGSPARAMVPVIVGGVLLIGLLVNLALLYFIARRRSEVAKWIFLVLLVIGILSLLKSLILPQPVAAPIVLRLFSIVQLALQIVCAWLLFRPDAKAWLK